MIELRQLLRASAPPREPSEAQRPPSTFSVRRSALNVERSLHTPPAPLRHLSRRARGFTLVETALALLAISLGLLGIFGLARHGLKASGDAEQETRCALLAESFFGTLRAKNDELTVRKYSLDQWWLFWFRFAAGTSDVTLHLPYSPDLSPNDSAIRVALGTHELDDFLTPSAAVVTIPWNPTYTLTLDLNGVDPTSATSIASVYERGEIDVLLKIHPGTLQSGAETRTYAMTLTYAGGLP
jgi:hypothetical protein